MEAEARMRSEQVAAEEARREADKLLAVHSAERTAMENQTRLQLQAEKEARLAAEHEA